MATTTDHRDTASGTEGLPSPESMVQSTVEAVFGTLPLGMSAGQSASAAGRVVRTTMTQPRALATHALQHAWEQVKVVAGTSEVAPEPGDRRFTDDAFEANPVYRRTAQSYLAWRNEVYALLDDLQLDAKSRERARFLLGLVTETVAPTNTLLGNPAALRHARETRGRSLRDGLRHLLWDIRNNGGMPSMVDSRPFDLGDTVAATPGGVVFRNEVLEIIQYAPQTDKVRQRPVVIVPPQINKYYIMDLAPDRSLVEHAIRGGQQVFMVSWRNPDEEKRDWDLDTYLAAVLEGIDAVTSITGAKDVNLVGVCAGGITTAALLGHLAHTGEDKVNSATFLVTILDWSVLSTMGTFISGPVVTAAIQKSQRDGVLRGDDLAKIFAWLRPNDLVWNYWVNNYLLGQNPAAFDVLAWNADTTNLPAGLHADFLHMAQDDVFTTPGALTALGSPVDLSEVEVDSFVVGAVNDHITPWQGCYETTRLLGGSSEFVLSTAGHIVAMVNPPGSRKSAYLTNVDGAGVDPEDWKAGATRVEGTWWDRWVEWLDERGGRTVNAPTSCGDDEHPVILPAPGTYVRA